MEDMGFPAGLDATMVADLTGKIPAGTRRIRIVTNLKIYWDAIRIDQTPEVKKYQKSAKFHCPRHRWSFWDIPKEIRLHPASDTVYSYSQRSPTGPMRTRRQEITRAMET